MTGLVDIRIGDRSPRGTPLAGLEAPWADRLEAVFDDAWARNPAPTIARWIERRQAANARLGARGQGRVHDSRPYASPPVAAAVLNERYADLGLRFETPERETVAVLRADTRRRELARQAVIARGDRGAGFAATSFGVGLLASAADPLNIASAFVPVVGPVRYAAMTARLGVHGARAARGALEGVAGAALVEPIVLAGAIAEDADYGAADSLLNLAFGGALGGGLHLAGGPLADALSRGAGRRRPRQRVAAAQQRTREAAFRAAVAQTAEGRQVDVEPILDADPGTAARTPFAPADGRMAASAPPDGRMAAFAPPDGRMAASAPPVEGVALAAEQYRNLLQAGARPGEFAVPAGFRATAEDLAWARDIKRGGAPAAEAPESLSRWVRRQGGIRSGDEAGELLADAEIDHRSGLLRRNGVQWDMLSQRAQEEGFFPPPGPNEPYGLTLSEFVDAVKRDYQDAPGTVTRDAEEVAFRERDEGLAESHAFHAEALGLDLRNVTDRELAWLMTRDESDVRLQGLAHRVDSLGEDESLEFAGRMDRDIAEAQQAELDALRDRPEALEPEELAAESDRSRPATLEELEASYDDYRRAVEAGRAGEPDAGAHGPSEGGPDAAAQDPARDPPAPAAQAQGPGAGPGAGRAPDLTGYAQRQDAPEADALADSRAAGELAALDRRGDAAPEELAGEADYLLEGLALDAEELAELQALDAALAETGEFGKAVEALAVCRAA